MTADLYYLLIWAIFIFILGFSFLPFTFLFFEKFFDKGYIFAKIIGLSIFSYIVFLLGSLKIVSFSQTNLVIIFVISSLIFFLAPQIKKIGTKIILRRDFSETLRKNWKIFLFEEIIFSLCLLTWATIRSFNPDIAGIEKFMDMSFVNSILRSDYFPPADPWFANFPINYYYFGHLITAVLTKLSQVPSFISFNLMLASLFALIFSGSFSFGLNLAISSFSKKVSIMCAFLTAFLLSLSGNLTTIYAFFKASSSEVAVPFWNLIFSPETFPNSYWYATATRFIYHTIHEFPAYALSLSDLHAHFLGTPLVILSIAFCLSLFFILSGKFNKTHFVFKFSLLYGFFLALEFMTNAWDAGIYFLLFAVTVFAISYFKKREQFSKALFLSSKTGLITLGGLIIFSLPFTLNFKPFVSGIGINCAPNFLTQLGSIGPILFENNYCQISPIWQILLLYGFFFLLTFFFYLVTLLKKLKSDVSFMVILFTLFGLFLVFLPEFTYLKDIYPSYFRANTMFKTAYQAFILFSLSSGFITFKLFSYFLTKPRNKISALAIFSFLFFPLFFLISIYSYFSIPSSHASLKRSQGLNGLSYLSKTFPSDYAAINWLNENINGQPTIVESLGDSYTNRGRVSVYTGLPTVLEWTAHEWLWRGSYQIAEPRIADIKKIYESENISETLNLLKKYKVNLVYIGDFEREDYKNLKEDKFYKIGKLIYQEGSSKIFEIKEAVK